MEDVVKELEIFMLYLNDNSIDFEQVSYGSATDDIEAPIAQAAEEAEKGIESFKKILIEEASSISEEKQSKLLGAYKSIVSKVVEAKDKEIEELRKEKDNKIKELIARVNELEKKKIG